MYRRNVYNFNVSNYSPQNCTPWRVFPFLFLPIIKIKTILKNMLPCLAYNEIMFAIKVDNSNGLETDVI